MAEISWIKLSVGLFDNRKVKRILALPRGNEILLFWIRLLCLGGRINRDGDLMFTKEQPFDAEGLAVECDLPTSLIQEWLELFISFGMLREKNGVYRITGWEKYQNVEGMERVREQAKNRMKKYRERLGAIRNESVTNADFEEGPQTAQHLGGTDICVVDVTSRYATEKEKEKEQEKEQEKFRSFSLACEEGERALKARERLGGKLGQGLVMISDAQMEDLLCRLSRDEFDHYVNVVAECEKKGKRFGKSHYEAILEMAAKDRRVLPRKSEEGA